jgi:class 3 adenylate cyclase
VLAVKPGAPVALKRKIAAILAADIAQYSRLIAEDEEEALTRLAAYRQVFDDFVAKAGGRIFNTAGDAVMCEFTSAVEAVRCAVDIQESLRTRNRAYPPSRQMHFRIGITIGDVVERDGDLLGDGVNIAARLEGLADPGGICVSRNVHEAVANKISLPFRDLGDREVKNIPHPVRAFTIDMATPGSGIKVEPREAPEERKRGPGLALMVSLAALVVAVGGVWFALNRPAPPLPPEPPKTAEPARPPEPQPPARDVAVNPEPPKPPDNATVIVTENLTPAEAFAKLAQSGGVVREPKTAPELYHNARSYEARGESAAARRDYLALVRLKAEFLDPHLRFAALLRAQDGRAGAREVYGEIGAAGGRVAALAHALQFDGPERLLRLTDFAEANPDYAPVFLLLADEFGEDRRNSPTLDDKRKELAYLEKFLAAEREGKLAPFFLDQSVLSSWAERASRREAALKPQLAPERVKVHASFMRHGSGWSVTAQAPEAATEILYRIGEAGEFRSAGHLQMVDQRTGKPMANPSFDLPAGQVATRIALRYRDVNGQLSEPTETLFEPMPALLRGQREMLERTKTSWIQFGKDSNANLLYYTHLVTFRCAIKEAKLGFDGGEPIRVLPMPPCDPSNPFATPANMLPYIRVGPMNKSAQLIVTFYDGDRSEELTFER